MRLALASDHAGFALRQALAEEAGRLGHEVAHHGAPSEDAYDYPHAADAVACEVLEGRADLGVLVCGSGIGVSIRANRFRGVRAALCHSEESAQLARLHNHANVLCLGARLIPEARAIECLRAFLSTEPDPAPRHENRVHLLDRNASCPGMVDTED